jgi:hypothetical protein
MPAPRPNILLHIGMTKTGSTAVQRVLAKRRDALAAQGVCYPVSPGPGGNHVMVPAACCEPAKHARFNPNDWRGLSPADAVARFRRDFAAEMAALPEGTRLVLLSAEQCSALLTTAEEIGRLHALLAPHAARIRVLVYLRRQDAHFASAWVEGLRAGSDAPPAFPAGGPETQPRYDYAAMLARWEAAFGEGAVEPRIYERRDLKDGDVVSDLLAAAGIALDIPGDDPDRRANASLHPDAIALLRLMRPKLAALPGPLRVRFVEALGRALPGPGWRPPAAEAAAFLARFAAVNEAVRRRWFPARPALFTEAPADGPAAEADPLSAALAMLSQDLQEAAAREAALQARIATLQSRLGVAEEEAKAWRAALRAAPDHPQAHHGLALLALAAGDRATAEAHLARLRAAHPAHTLTTRLARRLGAG